MRTFIRASFVAGLLSAITVVCGCSGNPTFGCNLTTNITVSPTSATVSHAAAPPGNQVQFIGAGSYAASGPHCAVPELSWIAYGTWSNPDPADIQISSAENSTNGTAVCLAPTNGLVTLTGAFTRGINPILTQSATQSVQLTCE